jgi:hypothetical protein
MFKFCGIKNDQLVITLSTLMTRLFIIINRQL